MFRSRFIQSAIVGLFLSVVAAMSASAQNGGIAEYRLGSGDEVRVTVFGQQDLSGKFTVDGSGFVWLEISPPAERRYAISKPTSSARSNPTT